MVCVWTHEEPEMKHHKTTNSVISKISAILLAMTLCMSLIMPMSVVNAFADNEDKSVASEESNEKDSEESKAKTKATPAATSITGYKTSYNKRYNQFFKIEADITPARGRDVQLQRYNSEEDCWTTILTATADSGDVSDADKEKAESSNADENSVAEQNEKPDADSAAITEQTAEPSVTENTAESGTVPTAGPATLIEENGVAHVTFVIPKEERQKTTSTWRIHVPAAKKASAASSDKITVITRNLEDISLSARTACIYRIDGDGQGTMIYSRNAATPVAQASTTKLMTAILLLESGLIDSTTKVSAHAAATPYAGGRMTVGDVFSTRDLLYAMLLPSANDAATAVAERVGGSEEAFVNMMNAKAEELGFTKTHFRNPHGLDADGHFTTAKELAKLTAYAYTFPEIRNCWATKYKVIKSLDKGIKWYLLSTNAIFGYVSNFLGGKTGTEGNARCCFTGVYTFNGATYVTVVLGSGYGFSRWSDTKKLHKYIQDYALSRY